MKEPVVKKGWVGIIVISMLTGFFFFLIIGGILVYYYAGAGWDLGIVAGILIFLGSVARLRPKEKEVSPDVQNKLAIIGIVREREKVIDGKIYGREIVRLPTYIRYVDLQNDILSLKGQNRNISIAGQSRSGKTQLMYFMVEQLKTFRGGDGKMTPLHRIIYQAHISDKYKNLGIPTLPMNKFVPFVFQDPNAFVEAWKLAFSMNMRGITATRIEPKLLELALEMRESKGNWEDFENALNKMLEAERSNITQEAISTILSVFRAVARDDETGEFRTMANIELPSDIVIDFTGLNQFAFVLYGEYLLRQLDREIEKGGREGTSITIDESHLFNREGTILPTISAMIGSMGSLVMATQMLHTLELGIRENSGTQFCFKQTGSKDLNIASTLSEPYHWIVQRLAPYEFVDLAQKDSHEGINIYRLINPKPDLKPVIEWKPVKVKVDEEKGEGKEMDYPQEIIRLLNEPANQQDLAKRFAKEFGKDVNYWKMTLKTYLRKMHQQNEIGATLTDYVKWIGDKEYLISEAMVYHRIGDYSYHDWLVENVANILYKKGFRPEIQPHGLPLADILVESPDRLAYEIETGSKNGYKLEETMQRIKDFEKQGYKVYVIVPNQEVKQKYKAFKNVMTALELFKEMREK